MARRQADWLGIGFDMWLLGAEVTRVMWLRGCLIALGGARAEREARRMVQEKIAANAQYGWLVATGRAGLSPQAAARAALGHYGPKVRSNGRRLTPI